MEKFKAFLKRKDIEISIKRYGIDALGAMAQGLFCSLLIGHPRLLTEIIKKRIITRL